MHIESQPLIPFYEQVSDLSHLMSAADCATAGRSRFFDCRQAPRDFHLDGNLLSFRSAYQSRHQENNIAQARWYPAARPNRRAVIIVPHWGADPGDYAVLCRLLNRAGISCLEMVTPYHGTRSPIGSRSGEYAVSADLVRTIASARQATLEIRCHADWLEQQGFGSIGLVGTSLGSSYVVLAAAHDERFSVNVLNHCSGHLPEVVWTAKITRPIRRTLERTTNLDGLRAIWKAINPTTYLPRLASRISKTLLIYGLFDDEFKLRYSRCTVRTWRALGMYAKAVAIPCGHRSLGRMPFKFLDAYHICTFLQENLHER